MAVVCCWRFWTDPMPCYQLPQTPPFIGEQKFLEPVWFAWFSCLTNTLVELIRRRLILERMLFSTHPWQDFSWWLCSSPSAHITLTVSCTLPLSLVLVLAPPAQTDCPCLALRLFTHWSLCWAQRVRPWSFTFCLPWGTFPSPEEHLLVSQWFPAETTKPFKVTLPVPLPTTHKLALALKCLPWDYQRWTNKKKCMRKGVGLVFLSLVKSGF